MSQVRPADEGQPTAVITLYSDIVGSPSLAFGRASISISRIGQREHTLMATLTYPVPEPINSKQALNKLSTLRWF